MFNRESGFDETISPIEALGDDNHVAILATVLVFMIIGIGTDIVSIPRIEKAVERFGERFISRVFTEGEALDCKGKSDPSPNLAARFAAKEAVLKALGTGISRGVGFRDVEVVGERGKRPEIRLHGKAKEIAHSMGGKSVHLSLSHDGGFAVAFAVLEG